MPKWCSEKVVDTAGGWRPVPCSRKAMPGRDTCWQHSPEARADREAVREARREAALAKARAEWDARDREKARTEAAFELARLVSGANGIAFPGEWRGLARRALGLPE